MTESTNGIEKSDGIERRQTFRLDMEKEFIDICWKNEANVEQTKQLVCLDFSRGGLKLESDTAIDITTPVSATFNVKNPNSLVLQGKVLRCIKQENGWFEIVLIF